MTRLRLVLVSRRFWPLVGGAETMMARLAARFRDHGVETTILTARWDQAWPAEFEHMGVRVVRLAQPRQPIWGTLEYMRQLDRWLRRRAGQFDLVFVSMLKHDAYAALRAGRRGAFPVVLRAEGAGLGGDVNWQLEARCGARIKSRCYHAAALIAPSRAVERELIAAGFDRSRIHYIPNGAPIPSERDVAARRAARRSLATSHPALSTADDTPLAVFAGRLDAAKGLGDLVEAWRLVANSHPSARLWLVGDGPYRAALATQINDLGLSGSVVLPGAFDNISQLLVAADVFVLPSWEEGMSLALLEAMAQGLPVVASDIPGNRDVVDADCGLLVPARCSDPLSAAMARVFLEPDRARQLGQNARARVRDHFSLDRAVDEHLRLFECLCALCPKA